MRKVHKETYYKIKLCGGGRYDNGYLDARPATVENARQIIDDNNGRAKEKGYRREPYMITKVEWEKEYLDGAFYSESKTETFVEIYGKHIK